MDILVVVRNIGERSLPLCLASLKKQKQDFVLVNETPFLKAVAKMWEIGSKSTAPFLLGLDADVILYEDAIEKIKEVIDYYMPKMASIGRIDFSVKDKFRGSVRAGCHLYNNKHSKTFFDFFQKLEYNPKVFKPERDNNQIIMDTLGLEKISYRIQEFGLHDYEQFYKHIYIKYYNIAVKSSPTHVDNVLALLKSDKKKNPKDFDYDFAIEGLIKGRGQDEAVTDARLYPSVDFFLKKLGIEEKAPIEKKG